MSALSTIWENTDGCAKQYRCATALYLVSVLYQSQSIIFDLGISSPGHYIDVVYCINHTNKRYMYQLISTARIKNILKTDYNAFLRTKKGCQSG